MMDNAFNPIRLEIAGVVVPLRRSDDSHGTVIFLMLVC